ncbi:MAG: tetratricopeptide repeat protein [Phormidesmis sp.]
MQDATQLSHYAQSHIVRAKSYIAQKNHKMAARELREALKITPQDSELHSIIGQVYYKQQLSGMAKSHFRQALKLNPTHKVAQKYGQLLGLSDPSPAPPLSSVKFAAPPDNTSKKAWLGKLLKY